MFHIAANLGNFHSWRGEYAQALPYYQQYLGLSPGLQDMEGEGKVCHNLGYAHYCLGQYRDAVRSEESSIWEANLLQKLCTWFLFILRKL